VEKGSAPVKRRVLVVDDNVDIARSLWMILQRMGHQAELAFDGRGALEKARYVRPDIVLLDLAMPGMDGYEVARRLRQEEALSRVFIVAVTGHGTDEDRARTRAAGFDLHLVKPVAPQLLETLLSQPGLI
jgi:two-component system CheB/CheR fusion protein